MFPCLRASCNLFCAGPSVTFDSSGHSTRRIVIRKAQAALKTTYRHETTVLTTIPPSFLTINTVRVPVSADKRGFHLDILKLVKVRNANEKIVISVSNTPPQIVAAQHDRYDSHRLWLHKGKAATAWYVHIGYLQGMTSKYKGASGMDATNSQPSVSMRTSGASQEQSCLL
jgi:hypothetical protein